MDKSSEDEVITDNRLPGLHGLPAELLDAVLRQLDANSRLQVFMTSKLLATALLRVVPRIKLIHPLPHDIIGQHLCELAPFLTEALQKRQQPKLHLTLQPASCHTDAIRQRHRAEPAAAASDAARLVAWMLGAVPLCGAVDSLAIGWHHSLDLAWEPAFSTALAAFLTSLTFRGGRMSIGHLATAINPLLLPKLLHLDIHGITITHEGQLGRSPFIGSRLQTLSLDAGMEVDPLLSRLVPLPPTLTQLVVRGTVRGSWNWDSLAAAVSRLTQLQQLRHTDIHRGWYEGGPGLIALLPALAHLPSLHTLVVDDDVVGQGQLDALLALTQITHLSITKFTGLTSSRASAACSWRKLGVHTMDWVTAAYLPLHSLTHPLHVYQLVGAMMEDVEIGDIDMEDIEEPSIEVLAAAELNLCERNKAGLVLDGALWLSKATVDLLTEQYLSHSRHTAHQPSHPTMASSSSFEGQITQGGPGSSNGQGGQQGSAAGAQPLMQRLSRCVKAVHIKEQGLSEELLSPDEQEALDVMFPDADLAAAELNLCERNKAGLVLDVSLCLGKATVDLLTEQYLSHSRRAAQQPTHPTVASSSSHSGPSTSLPSSSSLEGHITPGGPGSSSGLGVQQVSAAGGQALMQRLGHYVKELRITKQGLSEECLSSAILQAIAVLFPDAEI
ncbi:hypothetical protein QJQ45_010690 [Haematococcus lacustris]|nr:hypothetical protein QJQ45_010690 [Haematococcus lacustris]